MEHQSDVVELGYLFFFVFLVVEESGERDVVDTNVCDTNVKPKSDTYDHNLSPQTPP